MKLFNKKHWGDFIYGLIYPGFVGSMIYELIPQTKEEFTFESYFTISTILKILITFFYSLGYLHLYGDMNAIVKEEKRSWTYLLCDVFSSLFFFLTFVSVKVEHFGLGLILISLNPIFFFWYKRANQKDRSFHIPYMIASIGIGVLYIINSIFNLNWALFSNLKTLLLFFVTISFVIYLFYVFCFYENYSKAVDKQLYKRIEK